MTTVEQLLLIVDRAEYGSMLAEEAVALRAGMRRLAREAREGRCTPVSRPNSPSRSTGATGAESASEARGGFDPKPRPKGDEMSETELLQLQAELDQLNRDCDARDETIRHLDAGLTHEREQVARLEAELVAARSVIDRVRELRTPFVMWRDIVAALRGVPGADEPPAAAARIDREVL